jgi:lipase chaperone LimK
MNKAQSFLFSAAVVGGLSVYFFLPQATVQSQQQSLDLASLHEAPGRAGSIDQHALDWRQLKTFRAASVDGVLATDEFNNLIIDRQLRYWLDFYLSALGEASLVEIKQMMMAEIAKLPQPGRDQAIQLLTRYLNYKEQLANYDGMAESFSADLDGMAARHQWQKRQRREWFQPETVEAFWHMDEAVDDLALNKLLVRNSELSEEQREQAIKQLEQDMPEDWQALRHQALLASDLENQVEAMRRSAEFNESDVRDYRLQTVGPEATARLENLDKQQQQWQQRIISLIAEEQRIQGLQGLGDIEKQNLLETYQQQHFSAAERLRLDAAKQLLSATDD